MKKTSRRKIDVNVDELDRIIDGAMREPLNERDSQTLKTAVHALVEWTSRHGVRHNVMVNAVAPGPVETPMTRGSNLGPNPAG